MNTNTPNNDYRNRQNDPQRDAAIKPDEETLGKTDPQEEMKGPVSSIMNNINDAMKGDVSKEEADAKKEENM